MRKLTDLQLTGFYNYQIITWLNEGVGMCYTCGCDLPYEDHGDSRNITEHHLKEAGKTKEIKEAGKKTAKENMLKLLRLQKDKNELEEPNKDYSQEQQ